MEKIKRYIKGKKGSMYIEAAIMLPTFILAALSLIYIMKYSIALENVSQVCFDETKVYIREIYASSTVGNERGKIEKRLQEEVRQIDNIRVSHIKPYILSKYENLVFSYDVAYKVKLPLSLIPMEEPEVKQQIVFRSFVGKDNSNENLVDPSKPEQYREVFVFPKHGERYHIKSCTYITSYAREGRLDSYIRKKYSPCSICDAKKIGTSQSIYYFPNYGDKYHSRSCPLVEKYVVAMDLYEAEEKGYSPCKKCKGYIN